MNVTRESSISGIVRTLDLAITPEQVDAYNNGEPLETAFPTLDEKEREFYIAGVTDEDWDAMRLLQNAFKGEGKKES